jgi:glycosyltransferase involved in cell wall biosynthesis
MKILVVCESVYEYASGGKVVRFLSKILKEGGNVVKIIVLTEAREDIGDSFHNNNDIVYLERMGRTFSKVRHILPGPILHQFSKIINHFKPDIVHFTNYSFSSAYMIDIAKRRSKRVIVQPYTYHFYCRQGFAFRNKKACNSCSKNGYIEAVRNDCVKKRKIGSAFSFYLLNLRIKGYINVLSSNWFMDSVFVDLGVLNDNIFRFPIPYEVNQISTNYSIKDYFAFYGQPKDFKGLQMLIDTFKKLSNITLKIFPTNEFFMEERVENIEIVNNLTWANGLEKAIGEAKAVIIPSLWPTTTEYALYEAMNYSKPIIAFSVGAHNEFLQNRFNAMLSDSNDLEKFMGNIVELDNNQTLREEISRNALNTLIELNNPAVLYNNLMKAYALHT